MANKTISILKRLSNSMRSGMFDYEKYVGGGVYNTIDIDVTSVTKDSDGNIEDIDVRTPYGILTYNRVLDIMTPTTQMIINLLKMLDWEVKLGEDVFDDYTLIATTSGGVKMDFTVSQFHVVDDFVDYAQHFDIEREVEYLSENAEYREQFTYEQGKRDLYRFSKRILKDAEMLQNFR